MADLKFTPGPWRYNIATNGAVVQVSRRGPDTDVVEPDAANPWNSWLIAAAPDMYEELQRLASQFQCECGHKSCSIEAQRKDIESVLAKARGENQ